MSEEIVRRLMRKKSALAIKESLLLEAGADDEEEEEEVNFSKEEFEDDSDNEEDLSSDEEDTLEKKISSSKPRAPKMPASSEESSDEESDEIVDKGEEEEQSKLDVTSPEDAKSNVNPLDNIYAVNFKLGDEIQIVFTDGTSTGIEGSIDGYDTEGFYRIRLRDGFTISGLTDIALSSLIQHANENKCLCGCSNFVTEGKYVICDDCGRKIRESVDQLTLLDKKRPKGQRMIRSIPHDMSTSVRPNIAGTVTESEDMDSYRIRWYWDRESKNWITLVLDSEGNEVKSDYSGNRKDRDYIINVFKKSYNTEDARAYKKDE